MLKRAYRKEESLARHWAKQAISLCYDIDDESQNEFIPPIKEAIEALERDRRIIFIGDAGVGKSSLLAGIAQYPAISKATFEEDYRCWRYRNNDADTTCSAFIPCENLEGLELVDTASCADEGRKETLLALLKEADVIVAVIDARKAENAPVWSLLAALPQTQRSSSLIAVTHTDKLAAEAALQLNDMLRNFCRSKLQSMPALCFVSPTTMKGLEGFTQRIQEALEAPHGIKSIIKKIIDSATELLNKQYKILSAREIVSQKDNGFLTTVDKEIDNFLSHQLAGIKSYTDAYADAALQALPATLHAVKRTFGGWLSPLTLVRLELFGAGTEKYFYRTLRKDILTRQEASDDNFVLSCAGHWRNVRPRMKAAMECDIGDFPQSDLQRELLELRTRLGRDLYKPFTQNGVRQNISRIYLDCMTWMKTCILLICLALIAAGVLGFLGKTAIGSWLLVTAGCIWLFGTALHRFAARKIRKEVLNLAETLHEHLEEALSEDIAQLLTSRVSAYRKLYTEPKHKVTRHDAMLKPLQQQHREITRQISDILHR